MVKSIHKKVDSAQKNRVLNQLLYLKIIKGGQTYLLSETPGDKACERLFYQRVIICYLGSYSLIQCIVCVYLSVLSSNRKKFLKEVLQKISSAFPEEIGIVLKV